MNTRKINYDYCVKNNITPKQVLDILELCYIPSKETQELKKRIDKDREEAELLYYNEFYKLVKFEGVTNE